MIKYSNFLLSILIKRKSLYLIFIFFCGLFTAVFLSMTSAQEDDGVQKLFPLSTFIAWFPFVFSTIFTLTIVIRIFKTGETDGTELLISSKPVTRLKIVFARFIVLMLAIVAFQIFSFGFYILIVQIDDYATSNEKLKFALSLVTGGLIVSTIIGALIVIISSLLERTGTLTCGILFVSTVPILSFLVVPFARATGPVSVQQAKKLVKNNLSATKRSTINGESIYDPGVQDTNLTKISFIEKYAKKYYEDNKNSWYHTAKYFDVWYQLGRFYSLLAPKETKNNYTNETKYVSYRSMSESEFDTWYENARQTPIYYYQDIEGDDGEREIVRENHNYVGLFSEDEVRFEKQHLRSYFDDDTYARYKELTESGSITQASGLASRLAKLATDLWAEAVAKGIKLDSFLYDATRKAAQVKVLLDLLRPKIKDLFQLKREIDPRNSRILLYRAINDFQTNNEPFVKANFNTYSNEAVSMLENLGFQSTALKQVIELFFKSEILGADGFNFFNHNFDKSGTEPESLYQKVSEDYFIIRNFKLNEFIKSESVLIVWTIAGLLLLAISVLIYSRRDFR